MTIVDRPVESKVPAHAMMAVLPIVGMRCPMCALPARNSLLSRLGIIHVEIDLVAGPAAVHFDIKQAEPQPVRAAVVAAHGERSRASTLWCTT